MPCPNRLRAALGGALLATCSSLLHAQAPIPEDAPPEEDAPLGIVRGPVTFLPGLALEQRWDSNIWESADQEEDSWVSTVTPTLAARIETAASGWEFGYQGKGARYETSSDDDYFDHQARGRGILKLGQRQTLELSGGYYATHEDRGTGLTEGISATTLQLLLNEPDTYALTDAGIKYTLGSTGSRGTVVAEAGYLDRNYTNHDARTQFFDYEETRGGLTFLWRVLPKTSVLLQATANEISYAKDRPQEPTRDSAVLRYLAGLTWEATAKTTGTLKFGYQQKDFDAANRKDFDSPAWEAEVRWSPRTYSHIDIKTRRYDQETNFGGDFIDAKEYSVAWTHDWSRKWVSELTLSRVAQAYQELDRDQDLTQARLALRYQMRRWLGWELSWAHRNRSSNLDPLEFDRNQLMLGLKVAL